MAAASVRRWSVAAGLITTLVAAVGSPVGAVPRSTPFTPASTAGGPAPRTPVAQRYSAANFHDGGVIPFGTARSFPGPTGLTLSAPVVGFAPTPTSQGYWLVAADGGVFTAGDAGFHGSAGGYPIYAPVVGMAPTPTGLGYWLVALDGGVFSFGDAQFYGSTGGLPLNQPVIGMAATADGRGYWLFASDGGVFSFGDARFYGSMGGQPLNAPMVAMASSPDGRGYWMVSADGGMFTFGDAGFYGSLGDQTLTAPIVGLAPSRTGMGYWLAGADGRVYHFGDAAWHGDNPHDAPTAPISGIAATVDGLGYWLLDAQAYHTDFSHPGSGEPFAGAAAIVAAAAGQVGPDPVAGYFCNPYGPCEEWCALFATWVWEQAGVPIPRYAFTGDIYTWASRHGVAAGGTAWPLAGDAVLYGTGPWTVDTSVHVGIVAQVWPDGAVTTVEGDAGPGPPGSHNVLVNGPYLPSNSEAYNGVGIYAFVHP